MKNQNKFCLFPLIRTQSFQLDNYFIYLIVIRNDDNKQGGIKQKY